MIPILNGCRRPAAFARAIAGVGFVAALAVLATPGAAAAATGPVSGDATSDARLVSAVDAAGDRTTVPAGLQLQLKVGWKTYWRSPGDAGLPPRMDWSGSANVKSVAVRWPVPHRFSTLGIETLGYKGDIVLPLTVTVERPGEPVTLHGRIDLLVCSDICVPVTHDLRLDLPAGPAAPDADAATLIGRFDAQVPRLRGVGEAGAGGLTVDGVAADPVQGTLTLRLSSSALPLTAPEAYVEGGDGTFGTPDVALEDGGRAAVLTIPVASAPGSAPLAGKPLTITAVDRTAGGGTRAVETALTVTAAAPDGGLADLVPMLAVALLGGLILNLMPCVLPVLSLKLMTVIGQQGLERRRVRHGFLATAAGAIAAMLVLGGMLAATRMAGGLVGWGMQFQQPVFIAAMAALLLVFAANLAGAFEFRLPSAAMSVLGQAGGNGPAGHFAMGAFATLLATPCSAPFLGTAVGFALARGPLEILAVFGALGIGLAAPYLMVAALPGTIRLLPRPGRWMGVLRRLLAVALGGTAVWLLTVLAAQTSMAVAGIVAATAMAAVAALAAAFVGSLRGGDRSRRAAGPVAVLLLLASAGMPSLLSRTAEPGEATPSISPSARWQKFDEADIAPLVAQGRTVFVDVTADWCVTCIVNKRLVLDRDPVAGALSDGPVVTMKADMTSPNDAIMAYLAQHGRYGIPYNMVYGPGAPRGIALPELLSSNAVLDALGQAGAGS
ncbi:hypothetical protein VY88_22610 [Azospirillum thiophilum]|uniref:Copper resistance protein n=1 Tax=Azospirillum thiophilum TaxID=528244 RepID=A0AAC8W2Q8_9PROT|nr:protein-disulfide reductase DsbD domain-containing protein [Azospirillum thiophilum]ALG73876.1 hypothetical protein AL072_21780 [Azospirillum thiophilum]KJR63358.1 hypothetical protein VY88_22610 [Azospirillum thiophilum]